MTTDALLNDDSGYYDIQFNEDGDIAAAQTLDTAILLSIYEEARAAAHEIPESNRRRGWIGNESTPDFEQGSKAWLFEQERVTGSVLAELGVIISNALQWLVDEDIATSIEVENPILRNGKVSVCINLGRDGSKVDRRYYELWENSGVL